MHITVTTDELIRRIPGLTAGDRVLLSGVMYTARDAAHQRLAEMIETGQRLPFPLKDAVIYYCGPAPARPGDPTGPCGPTTSSRMDPFTPLMYRHGVKATVGKGPRSEEVRKALREYEAVYLAATGGVAALLAQRVLRSELVAFPDLGPEAVYRFEVSGFPLIVAADSHGNDIFGRAG